MATGLVSKLDQTDVLFSPADRLVLTGTSMEKGEKGGKLVFFEKDTFIKAFEMTVGTSYVIPLLLFSHHPRPKTTAVPWTA